jgi:hypothetical protein
MPSPNFADRFSFDSAALTPQACLLSETPDNEEQDPQDEGCNTLDNLPGAGPQIHVFLS